MLEFTASRSEKSGTLQLNAPKESVFPLLCPVREYDWLEGWECDLIRSDSGYAEENCVFIRDFYLEGAPELWVVCRYEPPVAIEFIKFAVHFKTGRLSIRLEDTGDDTCRATWTKLYTGLSNAGNAWIDAWSDEFFNMEIHILEKALNHYLETGTMLTGLREMAAGYR